METTLFSIILSTIITYFIARWQMKKNQITHFSINSYDIGKGLSDEFPQFSIRYGDEDFANNVKVLKGGFMNVGRNDITSLNGTDDIKLILPERCIVKAIKVVPSTDNLVINANTDEQNHCIIHFGICGNIFKSDEYFRYTAIVETNDEIDNLYDKLTFQHRILNTKKVQNTYIGQLKRYRRFRIMKYMLLVFLVASILSCICSICFQSTRFKICKYTTDEEVSLYINPQSNLYVCHNKFFPFFDCENITKEDLNSNYKILPVTTFSWCSSQTITAIMQVVLILIYIAVLYYIIWGKNAHIINIIRKNEEK